MVQSGRYLRYLFKWPEKSYRFLAFDAFVSGKEIMSIPRFMRNWLFRL